MLQSNSIFVIGMILRSRSRPEKTCSADKLSTLDPRLQFLNLVGGIFPGPATTHRVYQGIEWFSQLAGLQ